MTGRVHPLAPHFRTNSQHIVILNAAKDLPRNQQILRCAQNDSGEPWNRSYKAYSSMHPNNQRQLTTFSTKSKGK